MAKKKIAIITAGDSQTPSTRFRIVAYKSYLERHYDVNYFTGKREALKALGVNADIIIFQKCIPTIWFYIRIVLHGRRSIKLIFDIDDNIWTPVHGRWSLYTIVKMSVRRRLVSIFFDQIVVANELLGDYFLGRNVHLIKMVVPPVVESPREYPKEKSQKLKLGWAVHPQSLYQIQQLIPDISSIQDIVDIHILCGRDPVLPFRYTYWKFSHEAECEFFKLMDIGFVPSTNSNFDTHKSPIKLLLHLSAGAPVLSNGTSLGRQGLNDAAGVGTFNTGDLFKIVSAFSGCRARYEEWSHRALSYYRAHHIVEIGWKSWEEVLAK
jgi:hypothetical protein